MSTLALAQPGEDPNADRNQARSLAIEGVQLLEQGRAAEALDKLRAAEAKFHAPTHLMFIARAHQALGQLLEAHDHYVAVLAEPIPNYAPEAFHKARAQAQEEEKQVRSRIASLLIVVPEGSGAIAVSVDGRTIEPRRLAYPIAVAPGEHQVAATAGEHRFDGKVSAAIGKPTEVKLALPATMVEDKGAAPTESSFPVSAGIALGIGAAALAAGAITGAITLVQASDIKDQCPEDQCGPRPDLQEDTDSAKAIGNASTALFAIGGAAIATGVVLAVVLGDESGEEAAAPRLRIGPTGLAFSGSF